MTEGPVNKNQYELAHEAYKRGMHIHELEIHNNRTSSGTFEHKKKKKSLISKLAYYTLWICILSAVIYLIMVFVGDVLYTPDRESSYADDRQYKEVYERAVYIYQNDQDYHKALELFCSIPADCYDSKVLAWREQCCLMITKGLKDKGDDKYEFVFGSSP